MLVGWTHYPQHKAKITGLVIGGYGLGSSVFSLIATAMINPDNEGADVKEKDGGVTNHYFSEDIADNVPAALRYLALIYLCMASLGLMMMVNKAKTLYDTNEAENLCPTLKAGLKTFTFKLLVVCIYCSTAAGFYVMSAYKNFGQEKIDNDVFLTITGSLGSVFNGGFRYIWAHIMEIYNFKKVYLILCALQTVLVATLYYVAEIEALFLIWICLINCTEGGNFSLFPSVLAKLYGKKMGAELYGVLFLSLAFSSVTGFVLQLYLLKFVGYQAMFWALAVITAVSFVLIILKFEEKPPLLASSKDTTLLEDMETTNKDPS